MTLPLDRSYGFGQATPDGTRRAVERDVAVEAPVALEFNGVGYAVLMASPTQLEDLVTGFALAERLVERAEQILALDVVERAPGWLVRGALTPDRQPAIEARVRHRIAESSCGLCGIENLEQALRPLPPVQARSEAQEAALFRALDLLRPRQPGNARTGALHAAALCDAAGTPVLVREDVGRHNAFDKLIGAMARAGRGWDGGFALLSSRCSYELVEKAVLANCPLLVTLSAPTTLALDRAAGAGLRLAVLARPDALLWAAETG